MKQISLDNGRTFLDAAEAAQIMDDPENPISWDVIVHKMDDETREQVHAELAPCTPKEFLTRYLELATDNLVIG